MKINSRDKGRITVEYFSKNISLEFDQYINTVDFIEEVIAPIMIGMGYFPTNVYRDLGMRGTLKGIEEAVNEGRLYNG